MNNVSPDLALPLRTDDMAWIPTDPGKSFRPLRFEANGWSELMRLEPGSSVALHRHTGEVHAYNLAGTRQILGNDKVVGPGDYFYEPTGTIDSWQAVGALPCIVHIKVIGCKGQRRFVLLDGLRRTSGVIKRYRHAAPRPGIIRPLGDLVAPDRQFEGVVRWTLLRPQQ